MSAPDARAVRAAERLHRHASTHIFASDERAALHRARVERRRADTAAIISAEYAPLVEAARAAKMMLLMEAKSHNESGDPKRQSYVEPIMDAVETLRAALGGDK